MATTDTNVSNLIINTMTKAQYDSITPSATELYLITDEDGALPSQTGNSGKYLTTNGTIASWATVDSLPSQSGNTGKYLTTNGTIASWGTISIPVVDQTYSGTSTNAQSGTAVKSAIDSAISGYVPTSRTVNGKALSSNITLSASDVSALPDSTVIPVITNTYSASSTDGMSGVAVASAISGKQDTLTPGTGIAINNGTISATGTSYTLPAATTNTLGGIKVGSNLTIAADGTLSATAQSITVDSTLSTSSTNPVQNKVITSALDDKVDYAMVIVDYTA